MNNVNVYQQRPADAYAESPLHHAGLEGLIGKGPAGAGIKLRERKLLGHLILRGEPDDQAFARGVQAALGMPLPGALQLTTEGDRSLQWLSADEWLLIVPGGEEYAVEQKLRQALAGVHHAVMNVSGGQTLLELSGPNVRELLMKSSVYDFHPSSFPVGKAVGTVFAKSQLVIRHTAPETWELVVRRSFADYVWLWLQDASAEYGLSVSR